MIFDIFVYFDGKCEEAVNFYRGVFKSEPGHIMRFKDLKSSENFPVNKENENRILYTDIKIGNNTVMMADIHPDSCLKIGDNINLIVGFESEVELDEAFKKLSEGGKVINELKPTFFSSKYGEVEDKYGLFWGLNLYYEAK